MLNKILGFEHDSDWQRDSTVPGETCDSTGPVCRRFQVPSADETLHGRRLLFFSDLHWNRRSAETAEPLLRSIAAADADWVVFGGDLVRYLNNVPVALEILSRVQAKQGRLAVPGNRESQYFWLGPDFWRQRYGEAGFRFLVNESHESEQGPVFVGVDDLRHGMPELEAAASYATSDRFVVLLTHSPDVIGHTTGTFVGHMVLAGHTHGGQWRFPLLGPIYTSSKYWRQFDWGWYRRRSDGARLYISAGVGSTGRALLRRRLRCPTEIVVIDFVAAPPPCMAGQPIAAHMR